MEEKQLVKTSKYLARHLRHEPERLGITLEEGGWVSVDTLLAACRAHNFPVSRAQLDEVVARNDKKRFSFDPTGTKIRANQGHSVEVDLQLEPIVPPAILYHGTGHRSADAIWEHGLLPMSRHHVHLTLNLDTARSVGARHGRPVVFRVDAQAMHQAGHIFYRSDNGVYLADAVPAQFLTLEN